MDELIAVLFARKSVRIAVLLVIVTVLVLVALVSGRLSAIEITVFNNTGHSAHIAIYIDGAKVAEQDITETTWDASSLTIDGGFQDTYQVKPGPHAVRIESDGLVYSETVKFGLVPDEKFVVRTLVN